MSLKPQGIYVVLKLIAGGMRRPTYSQLSTDLVMRLPKCMPAFSALCPDGRCTAPNLHNRPNIGAVEEFLVHDSSA